MIKLYLKKKYASKDILRKSKSYSKHFRTNKSSSLILPFFLWKIIEVHNGKKYIPININKQKVGFILKAFIFKNKVKTVYSEFNVKITT